MSSSKPKAVSLRTERAKRAGTKTQAPVQSGFPAMRLRRNRRADWSRRLVRETSLTTDDLIWPIFVIEGTRVRTPVAAMPGVDRLSIDLAVKAAEQAAALGLPAIALFPNIDPSLRGAQSGQSGVPGGAGDQTGRAGDWHHRRRGARPLHQPRP
jgi:porphobilinogen synthase